MNATTDTQTTSHVGYGCGKIAQRPGISKGSVQKTLKRAKRRLGEG